MEKKQLERPGNVGGGPPERSGYCLRVQRIVPGRDASCLVVARTTSSKIASLRWTVPEFAKTDQGDLAKAAVVLGLKLHGLPAHPWIGAGNGMDEPDDDAALEFLAMQVVRGAERIAHNRRSGGASNRAIRGRGIPRP